MSAAKKDSPERLARRLLAAVGTVGGGGGGVGVLGRWPRRNLARAGWRRRC